jgi:RHS repeat-associated protein
MTYKAELCKTCGTDPCVASPEYEIQYLAEYFAYGKILREYVKDQRERYLTTGNERDEETGLDNRNARWYDSDNSRFTGVDALASEAPDWSPFRYGFNNPVMFVDPGGMFEDWYQDENNNIRFFENESKESLDAEGKTYTRLCSECDVKMGGKNFFASATGEMVPMLGGVTVPSSGVNSSNAAPTWLNDANPFIGAANVTAGYFQVGLLNESKQVASYGARISDKVRSAETLTRANRISSTSAARNFARAGTGLTYLSVGSTVYVK